MMIDVIDIQLKKNDLELDYHQVKLMIEVSIIIIILYNILLVKMKELIHEIENNHLQLVVRTIPIYHL